MLNDEQQFVMRRRDRRLRVEHFFEMQVVGIGHLLAKGHFRAVRAGIVRFRLMISDMSPAG